MKIFCQVSESLLRRSAYLAGIDRGSRADLRPRVDWRACRVEEGCSRLVIGTLEMLDANLLRSDSTPRGEELKKKSLNFKNGGN